MLLQRSHPLPCTSPLPSLPSLPCFASSVGPAYSAFPSRNGSSATPHPPLQHLFQICLFSIDFSMLRINKFISSVFHASILIFICFVISECFDHAFQTLCFADVFDYVITKSVTHIIILIFKIICFYRVIVMLHYHKVEASL
jgi:hypothetical protein